MTPFQVPLIAEKLSSMIRLVTVCTLVLLVVGCQSNEQVPYTGRERRALRYDENEMIRLSAELYDDTIEEVEVVRSTPEAELVQTVTQKIGRATGKALPWQGTLIHDDASVNVFALPGGKVGVYSGTLKVCRDEQELAVLLSHSIAHIVLQHQNERASAPIRQKVLGWPQEIYAGIWGTLSPGSRKATLNLFGVSNVLKEIVPYSPEHEAEADKVGLELLKKAGYDVNAAPQFWERFYQAFPDQNAGALKSHPDPGDRVTKLKTAIREQA